MRCLYCEVEVTTYPENGICPRCGGKLPPKPVQERPAQAQPVQVQMQPIYVPVQQPVIPIRGVNCCPKCGSTQISVGKRGYRWGLGIIWGILIPIVGLLVGFSGSRKSYGKCHACGRKWKQKKA